MNILRWIKLKYRYEIRQLRSVQVFAMLILLSGLYVGIRDNNVMIELNALIIGSGIFYAVNMIIKKTIN